MYFPHARPPKPRGLVGFANAHLVFSIIGVTILSLCYDWMHMKHLGVDKDFYGSVLWCMAYLFMPGTPSENVSEIHRFIQKWVKDNGEKPTVTPIVLSAFTKIRSPFAQFPKLKGTANALKHLGPPLLACFELF